ncbi:MAG: hypothetical protein HQ522_18390 [Bacteroidetes bacterium]|nr:hypothetical protein [Bacteroidota bacterium]
MKKKHLLISTIIMLIVACNVDRSSSNFIDNKSTPRPDYLTSNELQIGDKISYCDSFDNLLLDKSYPHSLNKKQDHEISKIGHVKLKDKLVNLNGRTIDGEIFLNIIVRNLSGEIIDSSDINTLSLNSYIGVDSYKCCKIKVVESGVKIIQDHGYMLRKWTDSTLIEISTQGKIKIKNYR